MFSTVQQALVLNEQQTPKQTGPPNLPVTACQASDGTSWTPDTAAHLLARSGRLAAATAHLRVAGPDSKGPGRPCSLTKFNVLS